jgi:hypothetical protein
MYWYYSMIKYGYCGNTGLVLVPSSGWPPRNTKTSWQQSRKDASPNSSLSTGRCSRRSPPTTRKTRYDCLTSRRSSLQRWSTNTMLVSKNSKLRVHLSFMPIRYNQEIETMQKPDNQLYREQRRVPKNISPQDSDNQAGTIKFVEAPRAHEMTRRC